MKRTILIAVVAVLSMGSLARADMEPVLVSEQESGSWTQTWNWGGVNAIAIRIVNAGTAGPLESPGLVSSGWVSVVNTPTAATITHAGIQPSFQFNIIFAGVFGGGGQYGQNVTYDLAGFANEQLDWSGRYMNGQYWLTTDWKPAYSEVVPAPAALLLGMLGLGLVGWVKRRIA